MTPAKALRAATALLVLAALAGVLLAAAPFALEYQPAGADWSQATKHHVATGAVVAGLLVLALLTMLSARLRALPDPRRVADER
jgi:hypothetical protein